MRTVHVTVSNLLYSAARKPAMLCKSIRLVVCLLLLAGALAHAEDRMRYRWHAADGSLHYGDVLPADAGKFGYDVMNPQGLVVKHVDRAKTAAERKVDAANAKRAEDVRSEVEQQQRSDRKLRATYPTESDLVRSQHVEGELLDQELDSMKIELASSEQLLSDQLDAAADFGHRKEPVPAKLSAQIIEMRERIVDQRRYLDRKQAERQAASARYAEELSRYRTLRSEPENSN